MKKLYSIIFLLLTFTTQVWCEDGDIFTAKSLEGIDISFRVISEADQTCEVYGYSLTEGNKTTMFPAIDNTYNGELSIPDKVNDYTVIGIGEYAFYYTKPSLVVIPFGCTYIGRQAFAYSEVKEVGIPGTIQRIDHGAFISCKQLTGIDIPSSVEDIGSSVFLYCSNLASVQFHEGNLKKIGSALFQGCHNMIDISIPEGVVSIGIKDSGTDFIWNCNKLKSLSLPNSLSEINEELLGKCPNLERIIVNRNYPASIANYTLVYPYDNPSIYETATLYVPKGSKSTYQQADLWKDFIKITEIEDVQAFSLTITSSGNGSASYNSTSIRNKTHSFTVNEGTNATVAFTPDTGYWIKSVKLNSTDVTSSVSNNKYTISNITTNTTLSVTFEAIPPTTYSLSITSSGNGCATYNSTAIRNKTQSFTVNEGTNATVTFTADNGYLIKSVKLNSTDVTSSVTNNKYTISNISANTTLAVTFEAIPPTTYSLSITSSGNGSALYNNTTIRNKTQSFTVNEGTNATVTFSPDNGYRIASVKLNNTDVTSSVSNNRYTINNITAYTTLAVTFEAIPPTTYSLSITASGNGSVSLSNTTIRNNTQSFTVNEGTNATITFTPDTGYRIKSVKLNNTDVTSSVANNKYTISNITANTTLAVTFEAIPATTYTLSITASGNGSASYNSTTIRNKTQSFTVNEGSNATVTFSPDNGYRIANVKLNNTNVTSSVSNNTYTISNITANTTLTVSFEAIPVTTYSLSITASGNGSVTYSGTTIVNKTQSFTINEGASAMLTFNPDNGYRVGSVIVNNTDVTSGVVNNRYTINNITANTTVSVAFEAIPETTYSLSITASGNGSVTYNGTTIKNQTQTFTVNEGAYATLALSAESGYRIASVRVNGSDDTYSVTNNQYTISYISQNTTIEVSFEAIPIPTYSLSITASGNGSATFNGTTVKNQTRSFTLDEGTTATVTFSPDNGNSVSSVKVNGNDVTSQISANRYTINNITANTTLEVTFQEDVNALTVDGLNYTVTSQGDKTVTFAGGDFGIVLTVPATITQNGTTWKVTGIDNNALKDNTELAAIIWNPEAAFTATVSNPNLLLYVKSAQYAPSTIKNVVVNGTANSITLTDAASGNNFYCPEAFTAQKISYIHHYSMMTGIGESKGWETIALPFDVQKIEHASKGTIVPFTQWRSGDTTKPFWLYELKSNGFAEASSIKANTPYIISMPNNPQYADQYQLVGNVTFSAENVTVSKSDNLQQPKYNDRTFVPNFQVQSSSLGYYALNVTNDYFTNNSGMTDGSRFVLNMRKILPFEAYMTTSSTNAPESIGIFDDMTTEIHEIPNDILNTVNSVYDLQGRKIEKSVLTKGVYIRNGQKVIIRQNRNDSNKKHE